MSRTLSALIFFIFTSVSVPLAVTAQDLVSGIDMSNFSKAVSAGEDFYEYVNEGWLIKNELPADQSNYGVFTKLNDQTQEAVRELILKAAASRDRQPGSDAQKVGDFYNAYTNVEVRNANGFEPISKMLEEVRELKTKKDVAIAIARLSRKGITQPIGYYVSPDARDSSSYTIYFTQYGTTLPDRDYYLKDDAMYKSVREEFPKYIEQLLSAVGVSDAGELAKHVVSIETDLAEAQWSKVENRDPIKTYNKLKASALAKTLHGMSFEDFLAITDCDSIDEYVVRQPSFFEKLNQIFDEHSVEAWKAYLAFHVADSMSPVLSEELEKLHFDFHDTKISGVSEQKPMWKRGVEATGSTLGEVVGKLYVDKYFTPAAKNKMVQLVENLKTAFAKRIDSLEWMTPPTKVQSHEKLSKFSTKIGYPDQWKDYNKLEIDPNDLVGNILRSAEFEHAREISKLGGPIDRNEWHMTPQTINAYYNPVMNEIVFPAAILQPPFFNMEADDAVNYGGIGSVIGHELSHGFDDKGSKYDGNGNLRNWWNETDRKEFERRSEGLVKQYGDYKPFEDMSVNGELTLGENIGDLGGLNVAYTAYQMSLGGKEAPVIDELTGDQRFFIGWGQVWPRHYREPELRRRLVVDPHSPSRYRVNGIVSNMSKFYEAFGITPDDKMFIEPEKRVKIW